MEPSKTSSPDVAWTGRALDFLTRKVGRPFTLAIIVLGASGWLVVNACAARAGWAFDPPPFFWLKRLCLLLTVAFLGLAHRAARKEKSRAKRILQERLDCLEQEALRDFLEGGTTVNTAPASDAAARTRRRESPIGRSPLH